MTMSEIKQSDLAMITPRQAAAVLHCDPYMINVQAHKDPSKLGFPVVVIGRRVKIPRLPFIAFIEGVKK